MPPPLAPTAPVATDSSPPLPASLHAMFHHAWDTEEFTASDAMDATGLTRSTAIDAIDTLRELGLVIELPNAREAGDYRKGRPARRFLLRGDAAVLVGVDAGNRHIGVTITDLRATPLASERTTRVLDSDDAAARRDIITALIDRALTECGRTRADVLSLGVGVPAPVDHAGHSPRHPGEFWARMNPGLIDALSWAPLVRVDNDASLAALAEAAVGAAEGCDDYVTLLAGDRLGAGVVVDGHLLRGRHGGVGEMVAFDHVDGVGGADGLGIHAARLAAEAIASGDAPASSALAALPPQEIDGRAVLELAAAGDPDAHRIVASVGEVLARIVSVLGSMYDPERVIVSGAIAAGIDGVIAAARRALPTDLDLPAPDVVASTLGADVVILGAIAAASANARSRALEVWPLRAGGAD